MRLAREVPMTFFNENNSQNRKENEPGGHEKISTKPTKKPVIEEENIKFSKFGGKNPEKSEEIPNKSTKKIPEKSEEIPNKFTKKIPTKEQPKKSKLSEESEEESPSQNSPVPDEELSESSFEYKKKNWMKRSENLEKCHQKVIFRMKNQANLLSLKKPEPLKKKKKT